MRADYFRNPLEAVPNTTSETAKIAPLIRGVMVRVIRRTARRRQIPRKVYPALRLPI
jgi:hypothetical protein